MFIASLFIKARTGKQSKCPSTEEWMWYRYTVQYYSVIKKDETGSFVEMCIDLKTVIQS